MLGHNFLKHLFRYQTVLSIIPLFELLHLHVRHSSDACIKVTVAEIVVTSSEILIGIAVVIGFVGNPIINFTASHSVVRSAISNFTVGIVKVLISNNIIGIGSNKFVEFSFAGDMPSLRKTTLHSTWITGTENRLYSNCARIMIDWPVVQVSSCILGGRYRSSVWVFRAIPIVSHPYLFAASHGIIPVAVHVLDRLWKIVPVFPSLLFRRIIDAVCFSIASSTHNVSY